ncbi:MAG: S41 family peptidase [Vallitaleaceae bacterium]|nr:S41 family peptidase [Vallitaleaceae bacterium]
MSYLMKRALALVLVLILLWVPMNFTLQAEETTGVEYEVLFKQVMDLIQKSYLNNKQVTQKDLFEAAMKGMFDKLDPYSEFLTPVENENFSNSINATFVGIGVQLLQVGDYATITNVFKESPAMKAGVLKGDYFKKVNGLDVAKMPVENVVKLVVGEAGTTVTIVFGRGATEYTVDIVREKVTVSTVETVDVIQLNKRLTSAQASKIGYISLSSFSETAPALFAKALQIQKEKGAKYLILDMRDNGGGYVSSAVDMAKAVVPKGGIVSFVDNTGSEYTYKSELAEAPFEIVALVNEYSASATEFFAGAIQDSRVGTLVGETTYGKGVAQYLMELTTDSNPLTVDNNYTIKLTEEEFFTRNHHKVNEIGITPDYVVEIPSFVLGGSKYYFNDKAEEIVAIEKVLAYLGYKVGVPDTVFDKMTFAAVKKFQADHKLYSYGVCDITTQKILNEALQKSVLEKDPQLDKAFELILQKMAQN